MKHAAICCLILAGWAAFEFTDHVVATPIGNITHGFIELLAPFALIYLIVLAVQLAPGWLPKADADGPKAQ